MRLKRPSNTCKYLLFWILYKEKSFSRHLATNNWIMISSLSKYSLYWNVFITNKLYASTKNPLNSDYCLPVTIFYVEQSSFYHFLWPSKISIKAKYLTATTFKEELIDHITSSEMAGDVSTSSFSYSYGLKGLE